MNALSTGLVVATIVFLLLVTNSRSEEDPLVVKTSSGPIKGANNTSKWTNKTIYTFLGIPYASPPTGDLRFKDPVPVQNWTTVKDCTSEQSSCYQPSSMFSISITSVAGMSEDCLYLNVYTPQLQPEGGLLPVIVWVHGGAYVTGSGNYSSCGPDFLVAEDVVVVTFNYRLGVFGFLTLDKAEVPGNAGLKDQRLALQWVQKEITQFGGDPTQVTFFGQSAGAASVHMHYLSPLYDGLFQRAISDSGNALAGWAARDDQMWYAKQLVGLVSCNRANMTAILLCLRAADPVILLSSQVKIPPKPSDDTHAVTMRFVASVDAWAETPFLPELPEVLIKQKKGPYIPFLMGTNKNEAAMYLLNMTVGEVVNSTNYLSSVIPRQVKDTCSNDQLKNLTDMIDKFYYNDTAPSRNNLGGFIDLNTDAWFTYNTAVTARYYREQADVFLYYFTFDGQFVDPSISYVDNEYNISVVSHSQELNYIYVLHGISQTASEDSDDVVTWKRMVRMWTNFAKYGKPTIGVDPLLQNVTWLPLNKESTRHLRIDVNLTMNLTDYLAERVAFWDSIVATTDAALCLQPTYLALITAALLNLFY